MIAGHPYSPWSLAFIAWELDLLASSLLLLWVARIEKLPVAGPALVRAHQNPRGGPYAPGFWSMTTHVGFGRLLGALPSGRPAGLPLADGISPGNGHDRRGPIASLRGAAQVCGPHVGNGLALNEKLDPMSPDTGGAGVGRPRRDTGGAQCDR